MMFLSAVEFCVQKNHLLFIVVFVLFKNLNVITVY
jgi:hypothetical protein